MLADLLQVVLYKLFMSPNAIKYTLACIADVAFPRVNFSVEMSPEPTIVVDGCIAIKFPVLTDENVEMLLNGKACYSEINSCDNKVKVKVFGLAEGKELFSLVDGDVVVNADLLSVSFALLSRYEETRVSERDKYGRFAYSDSLVKKYNIIDIPIIDEYALFLRKFVCDIFQSVSISPRKPRFIPTHDIDFLFRFSNFGKAVKAIAGDLLKRKSLSLSLKSLCDYVASRRNIERDPYVSGMLELLKVSVEHKLDSKFYFKALSRGKDCSYNIFSGRTKRCIERVISAGKSVGLHGGLDSYSSADVFASEKNNLQSVTNCEVDSSRQHFLRFDVHKTPQVWQKCGIRHDSTLGFPEHEGFRCGTCHPYRLYDVDNDCVTDVVEHPLIAMDTTLFQYRNLTVDEAFASICHLYERCVAVEGDFVLLWHNTTMFGELYSWYRNVYLRFINSLVEYCNQQTNL
ncbi:MAG: polysaccharide deacetylase family protein [Bacteroidales bacterium]|nr:polysaccharide deacetylase family protein [Bacteroidales bacterium]